MSEDRLKCVSCGTGNEEHEANCPVVTPDTQFYSYTQAVGYIELHDLQPGSGLVAPTPQWINGIQHTFPLKVQVQKCAKCGALLLPLDTAQHFNEHRKLNDALKELQLRTDKRPPNKRRIKKGETSGEERTGSTVQAEQA